MAVAVTQPSERRFTVADLFSCGGGTSAGFARRSIYSLVGAVDMQISKPSSGIGTSECNKTYQENHSILPLCEDIQELSPADFAIKSGFHGEGLDVLISCAPCTDFSRAKPSNHLSDSQKNSLVGRTGDYIEYFRPSVFFMENARELINGKYRHHHEQLVDRLTQMGYDVISQVHRFDEFGLPQIRERSIIIASRAGKARGFHDLWAGWKVSKNAVTVRSALARLAQWAAESQDTDLMGNISPKMRKVVLDRITATPKDGGSWIDLAQGGEFQSLLTPRCAASYAAGDQGSYPDIYGRMWWEKPAPTIKRECGHVGNGRYAHPVEDRLLTVREMAALQGFPFDYRFPARSIGNRYRHIGDAVPPLIAWQMSHLADWMLTDERPDLQACVMPRTTLMPTDLERSH